MDFIQALNHVYKNPIAEDEFSNPFLLYSHLKDLICDSYEDKKTLHVFYEIEKRIGLFKLLSEKTSDDLDSVYSLSSSVSDLLDKDAYIDFVNKIAEAVGIIITANDETSAPEEESDEQGITENESAVSVSEHETSDSNDAVIAPYSGSNQSYVSTASTYQPSRTSYYSSASYGKHDFGWKPFLIVLYFLFLAGSIAAMITGGVMGLPWETYQWFVGVSLSVIGVEAFIAVLYISIEVVAYEIWQGILLGICTLLCLGSIATMVVCGLIHLPIDIYGWVVEIGILVILIALMGGIICVLVEECEEDAILPVILVGLFIAGVSTMIVGGVMKLPWETYQWFVGAGTAVLLLEIGLPLVVAFGEENYSIANIITVGVLAITNLCLFIFLKQSYNIVCWWVSIPLMILHIGGIICGFEDDILPGWINIGIGCLTVLTFILNIVLF